MGIHRCCVYNCKNNDKILGVKLFKVTKRNFHAWAAAIPREKGNSLQPGTLYYVCNAHFSADCFMDYNQLKPAKVYLVSGSIPTIFNNGELTSISNATKHNDYITVEYELENIPPIEDQNKSIMLDTAKTIRLPEQIKSNHQILNYKDLRHIKRKNWSSLLISENEPKIILCYLNADLIHDRKLIIYPNLKYEVKIGFVNITIENSVPKFITIDEVENIIEIIENIMPCPTACILTTAQATKCLGYKTRSKNNYCSNCCDYYRLKRSYENNQKKTIAKKIRISENLNNNLQKEVTNVYVYKTWNNSRGEVSILNDELDKLKEKCANIGKNALETVLTNYQISDNLKETILACVATAKSKGKGRRYTKQWMHKCILLKIRSSKAYNLLRGENDNGTLPLPSMSTIQRYLSNLRSEFGFQKCVIDLMKKKSEHLSAMERRGVVVFDEMKLSSGIAFNKSKLSMEGFTDLGKYTPTNQSQQAGDHALVFMFQPFIGKWVQPVGAFLSLGAANGDILSQLVFDITILLENAGFFVDAIVCDGASWNRKVWSIYGITNECVSCTHFVDSGRKLRFISDFSHLIKNLRNWIIKQDNFLTPDGYVTISHWEQLLKYDMKRGIQLAPKLNQNHLNPVGFMKMRTGLAYQFFGIEIAAAFKTLYHNGIICTNVEPSCKFIERIFFLIEAMTSRSKHAALFVGGNENYQIKAIKTFIDYLKEWSDIVPKKNFITSNTFEGLIISLSATLELLEFLTTKHNFTYLMTSRLDQNCLEQFFGLVRQSGGCQDHPTPQKFIQIFRLLCSYSIAKPPKGSNITGGEMIECLLSVKDDVYKNTTEAKISSFELLMDDIIEKATLPALNDSQANTGLTEYNYAIFFFAGYVAKKFCKIISCNECKDALQSNEQLDNQDLYFNTRNYSGKLIRPSQNLLQICITLEKQVEIHTQNKLNVGPNILFDILNDFIDFPDDDEFEVSRNVCGLNLIGCLCHCKLLTCRIIKFFLTTRMFFLSKKINQSVTTKIKSKKLDKLAKFY